MSIFRGKSTGSVEAMGRSLDEIVDRATEQIEMFLAPREFDITHVDANPMITVAAGDSIVWAAVVAFESR